MGHALRFASTADLPAHLRQHVQAAKPDTPRAKRRTGDPEHQEQVVFMQRLAALAINRPALAMAVKRTHAIPNGGGRSKREAGRLKAEGVKAGVHDIFVAYPASGFHGLYIEMKSATGKPSREQSTWLHDSLALGYQAAVCRGADEAMRVWLDYVEG